MPAGTDFEFEFDAEGQYHKILAVNSAKVKSRGSQEFVERTWSLSCYTRATAPPSVCVANTETKAIANE